MSVMRYDMATGERLTSKATFKEDGTIEARSIITSIGVFPYRMADGTIRRELRLPEVVFDEAFLETIKNMPIYIGHRADEEGNFILDPVKRNEMAIGYTGDDPSGDNVYLSTSVRINRADGIDAVKKGIRSWSVGYHCDVREESGTWGGQEYDAVQVNLRGDHLALVRAGRQGDQAVLRMDSQDGIYDEEATPTDKVDNEILNTEEDTMAENLKVVKIDGIDYNAEETVIVKYNESVAKADTLENELKAVKTDMSVLEAERDSLKEQLDASKTKINELESARVDQAMIDAQVEKKLKLLDIASKAEIEMKADMADSDIVSAVIMKVFPTAKLDGRDEAYISARFDCAVEALEEKAAKDGDAANRVAGGSEVKSDEAPGSLEAKAKERAAKARMDQWDLSKKEAK